MKTLLRIRLDKNFDGFNLGQDSGMIGNVYAIKSDIYPNPSQNIYDITIPTGIESTFNEVEINPGIYVVECILPSGNIIKEDIEIEDGETKEVILKDDPSPREHLAWQQLSGNLIKKSEEPQVKRGFIDFGNASDYLRYKNQDFDPLSDKLSRQRDIPYLGNDDSDFKFRIEKQFDLTLNGFVEISNARLKQVSNSTVWNSLELLTKIGESSELKSIQNESIQVRNGELNQLIKWINPDQQDDGINYYRIQPFYDNEVRNILLWTSSGAELVFVPDKWQNLKTDDYANIELVFDASSNSEFVLNTGVSNTYMASALAYMASGSLVKAKHYINNASDMLFQKIKNPYAAAAGGFILLETINWLEMVDENSPYYQKWKDWSQWINNLCDWFEWLPDGAVLHAWSLISIGENDLAKEQFKKAYNRGIPIYSAIFSKLVEGLKLFSSDDEEIDQIFKKVRRISWRVNMKQLFTTIRLGATLKDK